MVAGPDVGDVRADVLHHTAGLVAEHERTGRRRHAVDRGQVGVAHPRGGDPHEDIARAWIAQVQVRDLDRSARTVEHGGPDPHGAGLGSRGSPRTCSPMMFFWISSVPPPRRRPGADSTSSDQP